MRGDLDWIVMKCLEKDRARRYETANGLALDIEHHLNHEPVAAAAPSTLYRAGKFVRRHKAGLAFASALAFLLVMGVFISTWQAVRATRAERAQTLLRQQAEAARANETRMRRQAEADRRRPRPRPTRASRSPSSSRTCWIGVGPSVALGRDTTLLKEILDKTAQRVGEVLANQPEVEAELQNTLGEVYVALGQFDQAETMLTRRSLCGGPWATRRRWPTLWTPWPSP